MPDQTKSIIGYLICVICLATATYLSNMTIEEARQKQDIEVKHDNRN